MRSPHIEDFSYPHSKRKRQILRDDLLNFSVLLNGILIPVKAVESALARSTQLLIATNDDETFPVSLVGSSVAIKYRDRYFVICTRHQLKDWSKLERIALLINDGELAITSGGVRHFVDGINDSDFNDLVAFEFTEPCRQLASLRQLFFDLNQLPPDAASERIICLVASGFPFKDQIYELEEKRHLGQVKRIVKYAPDGPRQPSDISLMRLQSLDQIDFEPDGMSGGGVFVIQFDDNLQAHAYFAGIITRAGRTRLHFVKSGLVSQFLDLWID